MFNLRYFICSSVYAALFCNVQTQLENLALNQNVTQSSYHGGYPPENAVDGNVEQILDKCSHTGWNPTPSWLKVDLSWIYEIKSIKIYHRNATNYRLNGFQIIVSANGKWENKQPCYEDPIEQNATYQPSIVTIETCKGPARYVNISNDKGYGQYGPILEICEVQIYGCPKNKYGENCTLDCHCKQKGCFYENGTCFIPGCEAGWHGTSCNQECSKNKFGPNCNFTCHCHDGYCNRSTGVCDIPGCTAGWKGDKCNTSCFSNKFGFESNSTCHCKQGSCDNTDGECFEPGCKSGWKGYNCSIECDDNTFGPDCKDTCYCLNGTCDKIIGACNIPGCKPGYQDETCSVACDKDFFGSNCSSKCFCKANTCDSKTGKCNNDMCRDGYIGETCNKKCDNGTFGYMCASECHCLIGSCHNVYGTCNLQGCREGWKGSTCSEKIQKELAAKPSTGVIAGVVSAGAVIAAMVIGLLLYKKRREVTKDKQNNQNNIDGIIDLKASVSGVSVNVDNVQKNQKVVEVNETEYANLEPRTNTNISIKELKTRLLRSTVKEELEKEYEDIKNDPSIPTTAGEKTENKDKNRFLAIFPYDHSRVVLETLPGVPNSDYINANYIYGVHSRDKSIYVAAQVPKRTTVIDFWRMIWQIKSGIIVMLANPMEKGKVFHSVDIW